MNLIVWNLEMLLFINKFPNIQIYNNKYKQKQCFGKPLPPPQFPIPTPLLFPSPLHVPFGTLTSSSSVLHGTSTPVLHIP